jgi:RND family efflux transporter MFP subunit
MVAWLAGTFNDKIAPNINTSTASNIPVSTVTVTKRLVNVFESVPASITAKQATIISSRLLARVESIKVRAGDKVKQGDILISLENNELQAQVIEAKENVNARQVRNSEAEKNYQRAQALFKKGIVSTFDLDKSKADYQSNVAQLTAAQQSLKQAQAALSYTTLRAPINGKIVDRFTEPGNTAQPGNKLLSLYNPLSLRVEAQVREQLAVNLQSGQRLQVTIPSTNQTLIGQIEEIVPAANTGSRTFLIKISLPFQENLLPGMYAKLLIPAGDVNKLFIPHNTVSHMGQLTFVQLNVNGNAQRRFIRISEVNPQGLVSVISGLAEGDEVITAIK